LDAFIGTFVASSVLFRVWKKRIIKNIGITNLNRRIVMWVIQIKERDLSLSVVRKLDNYPYMGYYRKT